MKLLTKVQLLKCSLGEVICSFLPQQHNMLWLLFCAALIGYVVWQTYTVTERFPSLCYHGQTAMRADGMYAAEQR